MFIFVLFMIFVFLYFCFEKKSIFLSRVFGSSALISLLLIPVLSFGYTIFDAPPEDPVAFIKWAFNSITSFRGASASVITGTSITILLWIFNYFKTKVFMEKLGEWKFIIPLVLGAIAELVFNFPDPFTWSALISVIVAGASMNGALAIAIHHTGKRIGTVIKKKLEMI